MDSCSYYTPFLGPLKDNGEGKSSLVGRTVVSAPECMFCLEEKLARCGSINQFMGLASDLAGWSVTWKDMRGKLVTKTFGGEVYGFTPPYG